MKIVVTGGRDYCGIMSEQDLVWSIMDGYYDEDLHLAHGGANGLDTCVDKWFKKRTRGALHGRLAVYPADWNRYGNSAGHKRNAAMLDFEKPEIVIRFPGGAGTADCARLATARRITIHEYDRNGKGKVITFDDIFDATAEELPREPFHDWGAPPGGFTVAPQNLIPPAAGSPVYGPNGEIIGISMGTPIGKTLAPGDTITILTSGITMTES